MEDQRFDEIARLLAGQTSRRQALKALAATTVGSLLGLRAFGDVVAAKSCTPNGRHCSAKTQCCSGFCDSTTGKCGCQAGVCNASCPCPSGQTCLNGTCCSTSQVCGSTCGCPAGQVCQNGACVTATCPANNDFCNLSVSCGTSANGDACYCATDVSGSAVCIAVGSDTLNACSGCTSDADCATFGDYICVTGSCCGGVTNGTACVKRC